MAFDDVLASRFERANLLYLELIDALSPEQLASRLPGLPSSTIAGQLWCVLGARESYPRAARAGSWQGFSGPLDEAKMTDARQAQSAASALGRADRRPGRASALASR